MLDALLLTVLHMLPKASAAEVITLPAPFGGTSFVTIMQNLVLFLSVASVSVCLAIFLIGAFYMVLYAYDENKVKTGKDIMIGSLIGLAIILGSYGILRTALYLIYA